MRIVFIGATEFSWHMLDELLRNDAEVAAVFSLGSSCRTTVPDYRDLTDLTMDRHVPCFSTDEIAVDENLQRLHWLKPDVILVMGLERPLPKGFLQVPPAGVIKSCPTLSPWDCGHSMLSRSILSGQERGGLTFFYLKEPDEGGDVILRREWPITVEDSAASLYRRMVGVGREMMRELLGQLDSGVVSAGPVEHDETDLLPPNGPYDGRLGWEENSRSVYDLIRAGTHPFRGAFLHVDDRKITVWKAHLSYEGHEAAPGEVIGIYEKGVEVACGAGSVILQIVQIGEVGPEEPARRAFDRLGICVGARLGVSGPNTTAPVEKPKRSGTSQSITSNLSVQ